MMHLLPRLEYRIHSDKSPDEICTALKSVTKSREETTYRPYIAFIGKVHPFDFENTILLFPFASSIYYRCIT